MTNQTNNSRKKKKISMQQKITNRKKKTIKKINKGEKDDQTAKQTNQQTKQTTFKEREGKKKKRERKKSRKKDIEKGKKSRKKDIEKGKKERTNAGRKEQKTVCLLVGCLTSQQQASASQGWICSDNFACCHTEIDVADPTFYLTQSQYTDTGPTSPSADPITPGTWQGSHWSARESATF